jgi:branched-chain amino acid transport system ATP-binding protein
MSEVLLRGTDITRRWGGLVAVNKVSLDFARGQVHAVIGTNGAGKSTLVNILSGEIPPSDGRVELLGQDVTAWTQPKRARAGLGRSYQRTTIYPSFSVFENCRLAAQAQASPIGSTARPACCRTARSASSRSRCAWRPGRACCCSTSRWPAWAPRKPTACSRCWPN